MKLASEILILVMLIMSNGRVFTSKKAKVDALVMLSPFAFFLAILHIIAFSVDFFSVLILLASFLVLLSNFHALFRYSSRLIVDRYSPLMKVWAVVTVFFSLAILVSAIYFRPVELNNKKLGITETKTILSGNFMGGFSEAEKFTIANGHLFEFAPINSSSETRGDATDPIIIFMPDKRGDTENYKPFLQLLAQAGFTIYSADFFANDGKWLHTFEDTQIIRRIALVIRSITNNQQFMSHREFYTYNYSREYTAMINFFDKKYNKDCKYIFITDALGLEAAKDIQKKYPEKIQFVYDISKIDLYKTSGYGFIQQTDPLLAHILHVDNDRTLFNAKYVVLKTRDSLLAAKVSDDVAETELE